jgi:hypothetical protein
VVNVQMTEERCLLAVRRRLATLHGAGAHCARTEPARL